MTMEGGQNSALEADFNVNFRGSQVDELIKKTPEAIRKAVLRQIKKPPVIAEAESDERSVLQGMKILAEKTTPKPTDVTLFIPLDRGLAELLQKSRCATVEEMLDKIRNLAIKENLGFLSGIDGDKRQLIINLHKQSGHDYVKPMDPEDASFICIFDREVH